MYLVAYTSPATSFVDNHNRDLLRDVIQPVLAQRRNDSTAIRSACYNTTPTHVCYKK